jgi:outer membrane protein assembly factor BamB
MVFFGSADENVYAVDADTGEEQWVFETGGPVFSSPAYRDGLIYVGSGDGHLYAVDGSTGDMVWFYGTEGFVYSSPVVTEDTVYFGSNDQKLYAVENEASDDETYREYQEQIEERKRKIEDERYDPEEKEAEIMERYYDR